MVILLEIFVFKFTWRVLSLTQGKWLGESSREFEKGYKVQIEYYVVNPCCSKGLYQGSVGDLAEAFM